MESSAVMAMEYLVSEVKYLVKSGFEMLKFMVKVERSLNSRCPMVTKGWTLMQCRRVEEAAVEEAAVEEEFREKGCKSKVFESESGLHFLNHELCC
jgi:hypothetical protein